jgi:GT2 family glycosyltransferase
MQDSSFASIVIPTRNRAGLVKDTVDSLLAQDYPSNRYEIIVVDDGSTDDTPEAMRAFQAGTDPSVTYIRRQPVCANAARNVGIRAARGDPIVLVDDDIEAPSDWLRAFVECAQRNPEADCIGGRIRLRLEGKPPRFCGREPFGDTELDLGDEEKEARTVWSANMAIRRSAFEKIGPLNESLSIAGDEEEWELRLLDAGGRIIYTPDAWVWHRRTQSDLRFWRMVRVRFRRGRAQVVFAHAIGRDYRVRTELLAIARSLIHAARRWCSAGLLAASIQAGRICGLIETRLVNLRRAHRPTDT